MSLRSSLLSVVFAAGVLATLPIPTFAQCPPTSVTATVEVADGSTPNPNAPPMVFAEPGHPGFQYQSGWGTHSFNLGPGQWTFRSAGGNYLPTPSDGTASCSSDPLTGCVTCGGKTSYTFPLFANYGTIRGSVTTLPKATAAGVVQIQATSGGYTMSEASGEYNFARLANYYNAIQNNWGLVVYGNGATEGTQTYTIYPIGHDYLAVDRTVRSSKAEIANFTIWSGGQRTHMRPCEHCPQAPSASGNPVSLATGNVFFDQEDASVPGVGTTIRFVRSYNSDNRGDGLYGIFGRGWHHAYERRVSVPSTGLLMLRRANGVPQYFYDNNADLRYDSTVPFMLHSWFEQQGDGTFIRRFHDGSSELYASLANSGRLTSVTDASGNVTTLTYNGSGQLTAITAPGGRALTLSYTNGLVSSLSGPSGTLATYTYANGLLAGVQYADAAGSGFTYAYAAVSNALTSVTDRSGRKVETHAYDGAGRGITSEIADGQEKLTFEYRTNQTVVRDALGGVTTYDLAWVWGQLLVTKVTGPCDSCGGSSETQQWTYDDRGRVLTHTDADGKVTSYTYDATMGDVLAVTETKGTDSRTTTYTYANTGRVESVTAPDSGTVQYVQGTAGPTSITDAVNRTTAITYRTDGQIATVTDPRLKTTTFGYDATTGDLTSVTDPLSHATTFRYDAMGRRDRVTDALTNATTSTYDVRGRVTQVTTPDNKFTTFSYDSGGRRTEVTDPMGRVTRYKYDVYGRLEAVTDPLGGVTRYAYDAMSHLIALTDARGQTTHFEYDGYARVKTVRYPGGGAETFTYTPLGRLATRTDRKAVVTTYEYDSYGRLKRKTYSDSTPEVTYTYDGADRLKTAANGTDTLSWNYDLAGQLLNEASTKNASTVAYTYDGAGSRLTVSLDGQLFVTYGYDDAARLTSITRGTNVFGFSYDLANRRTGMTYPNTVATTYAYDTLSRLTSLGAQAGSTVITSFAYAYDDAGNRTTKTTPDFTEAYSYDPLYRLTNVDRTAGSPSRWVYGYDVVGNRTSAQVNDSVQSGTYNSQNQLSSMTGGGPLLVRGSVNEAALVKVNGQPARLLPGSVFEATISAAPGSNSFTVEATDARGNVRTSTYQADVSGTGATYTYDSNGNLTQKIEGATTWTYEWNAENQLTRVLSNGAEAARYGYDPLGRRIEKVAGGVTTAYVLDSGNTLRESRSDSTSFTYVHPRAIDQPLARQNQAGTWQYLHLDGLDSLIRVTDASGQTVQTLDYDAWGSLNSPTISGYAFTGREWDPETGLYYYRARYYDPRVGLFLSEDPIRSKRSMYAYVDGNPVNRIDPLGLQAIPCKGCDPSNTQQVQGAFGGLCSAMMKPKCAGALHRNGLIPCMSSMCNNRPPTVQCSAEQPPAPVCGATRGRAIFLYPNAFDPKSGCGVQKTLIHEISHVCISGRRQPAAPDCHEGDPFCKTAWSDATEQRVKDLEENCGGN